MAGMVEEGTQKEEFGCPSDPPSSDTKESADPPPLPTQERDRLKFTIGFTRHDKSLCGGGGLI